MPVSTRQSVMDSPLLTALLTKYVNATATMPHTKAATCTTNMFAPMSSAKEAPKPAPAEAPNRSGEHMGFLKRPW